MRDEPPHWLKESCALVGNLFAARPDLKAATPYELLGWAMKCLEMAIDEWSWQGAASALVLIAEARKRIADEHGRLMDLTLAVGDAVRDEARSLAVAIAKDIYAGQKERTKKAYMAGFREACEPRQRKPALRVYREDDEEEALSGSA